MKIFQLSVEKPQGVLLKAEKVLSITGRLTTRGMNHWRVFEQVCTEVARRVSCGRVALTRRSWSSRVRAV